MRKHGHEISSDMTGMALPGGYVGGDERRKSVEEENAAIEALKIVKQGKVGSLEFRLTEIKDAKNHISEVEEVCRRLEKEIQEIDAGIKELS